ncbi:MAG: hypothetical protein AB7E47_09420 [Desulfovibrionaceae bacterium]
MQRYSDLNVRNVLWWTVFAVVCVWLQWLVPGVDFLVAGVVLSLQEGRGAQTAWLILLCILVQEGAGALAFGAGLLWYGMAVALFLGGRWLFESRNVFFIFLLGVVLGGGHFLLVQMMATLQEYAVDTASLATASLAQAVLLLPAWLLASTLRARYYRP